MTVKLNVRVIGCGGTGLCLLNVLPRYLNYLEQFSPELTLIDGDDFEEKNRDRQSFLQTGNKAKVTAQEIKREFPNMPCTIVEDYLNETNLSMHIKDDDVVFCCVDNHATRKLVSAHCEKLDDIVLISSGNEYYNGNVQVQIRKNGKCLTESVTKNQQDIRDSDDDIPVKAVGCGVLQVSEPQLLITNNESAQRMLCAFLAWHEGLFNDPTRKYDNVYFDVLANKVNPVKRSN